MRNCILWFAVLVLTPITLFFCYSWRVGGDTAAASYFFPFFVFTTTLVVIVDNNDRLFRVLLLIGGSLNGLAIWSNGGYMPVSGKYFNGNTTAIWKLADENTKFLPLCDIYVGGSSIGDFVLVVAFMVWIITLGVKNVPQRPACSVGEKV